MCLWSTISLAPLHEPLEALAMSNVVNFDRQAREQSRQIEEQSKIAEHAIDRAKEEWKRLAMMKQQQRR
jgi:hypothetical protein